MKRMVWRARLRARVVAALGLPVVAREGREAATATTVFVVAAAAVTVEEVVAEAAGAEGRGSWVEEARRRAVRAAAGVATEVEAEVEAAAVVV